MDNNLIDQNKIIETTIELMKEINAIGFDNQLQFNFPVELSNSSSAAGDVRVICNVFTRFERKIERMRISKNYAWTRELLRDVVAHELIHVYETQVLKIKASHGYQFKSQMYKLNRLGFKVNIRHSMKSTKPKIAKVKKVAFILSEDKKKFTPLSLSLVLQIKKHEDSVKKSYGNFIIGQISSDKINGMKISRSLRGYYPMTQEKLQQLGLA